MGPMPDGDYYIAPFDPDWALRFVMERHRLQETLGFETWRMEHVGSTAVAGLGAKPIIDLMVGIDFRPTMDTASQILAALQNLGYNCKGTETVPGTLYCPKVQPVRLNLHLTQYQSEFWVDHLLFRDYLRKHEEVSKAYEALKRGILAKLGPDPDRAAYSDQKDDFIMDVLKKARIDV
jgi:GrpB-like predicted nucleotidyltransferase (UPF0157 family)